MTKSQVAREYRAKHPSYPSKKLGRIIYRDHNLLFKDEEDARSALRRIEGKQGQSVSSTNKAFEMTEARPYNPYKLPDSDEKDYLPYILSGHKRLALFADLHVPYHDISVITAAINFCKKDKPDALLINGDALDFFGLSRFMKDPSKKNFAKELDDWKSLFEVFEKQLKCKIYYKIGNHEERYEHFLFAKASELLGVDEFELASILKARAKGIEVVGGKRIIKANELNILHGHEFMQSIFSPVNVARGLYLRGKANAIQAHSHQTSMHTERDLNGKVVTTWSQGCMCSMSPEYMPINRWNAGFAVVDLDENGAEFHVRNKTIYKGKVM